MTIWGTSTPDNEVAYDPTAMPTIAFDVKSDANVGANDDPFRILVEQ